MSSITPFDPGDKEPQERFLDFLAETFGEEAALIFSVCEQGAWFDDLADLTGLSRREVFHAFDALRTAGLLAGGGHRIRLGGEPLSRMCAQLGLANPWLEKSGTGSLGIDPSTGSPDPGSESFTGLWGSESFSEKSDREEDKKPSSGDPGSSHPLAAYFGREPFADERLEWQRLLAAIPGFGPEDWRKLIAETRAYSLNTYGEAPISIRLLERAVARHLAKEQGSAHQKQRQAAERGEDRAHLRRQIAGFERQEQRLNEREEELRVFCDGQPEDRRPPYEAMETLRLEAGEDYPQLVRPKNDEEGRLARFSHPFPIRDLPPKRCDGCWELCDRGFLLPTPSNDLTPLHPHPYRMIYSHECNCAMLREKEELRKQLKSLRARLASLEGE